MAQQDKVTIGCDPEIFIRDKETKEIQPCVGVLPGTKDKPHPMNVAENITTSKTNYMRSKNKYKSMQHTYVRQGKESSGYFVQEDNVMAEFNTPPTSGVNSFYGSVVTAVGSVISLLPKKYELDSAEEHLFKEEQLQSPQAQLIGCEPDMDAYNMGSIRTNPPPVGLKRQCGGHIHIGGKFNCPPFVVALFLEYAIMSDPKMWPSSFAEWYRQPGSFREKPYGIEYRTPSNNWIWNKRATQLIARHTLCTGSFLGSADASEIQKQFGLIPWVEFRRILMARDAKAMNNLKRNTLVKGI